MENKLVIEKINKPKLIVNRNLLEINSIERIRGKVLKSVQNHHKSPAISNEFPQDGLKLEQDILTDGITFIEFFLNKRNKSILNNLNRDNYIKNLCENFNNTRINFSKVVSIGAKLLNIKGMPNYDTYIYSHSLMVILLLLLEKLHLILIIHKYSLLKRPTVNF